MSRLTVGIIVSTLLLVLGIGCSNSSNPVSNSGDGPEAIVSQDNHQITGVYSVTFNPDSSEFTVEPSRDLAGYTHFNWTQYLNMCTNGCVRFRVDSFLGWGMFAVSFSMTNPVSLTPYDPRLIIADAKGKQFLGYDGLTKLWPAIGTTYKPFYAVAKDQPNRIMPGYDTDYGNFTLVFTPGCEYNMTIITECSINQNIGEPYELTSLGVVDGMLTPNGTTPVTIACTVSDWQDDITSVRAYTNQFNGQIGDMVWDETNLYWKYTFYNENHVPEGKYDVLLEANSPNSWGVATYNLVKFLKVEPDIIVPSDYVVYSKATAENVFEVYKIAFNGLTDTALTSYAANSTASGFTADFQKVIFNSDYASPGEMQAFVMGIDGSGEVALGNIKVVGANADGTVFLLYDAISQKMSVYTESGGLVQLAQTQVLDCALAANASLIGYIKNDRGSIDVYTCDQTGANELKLTKDGMVVTDKANITISDDGLVIAYNAEDPSPQTDQEIFTLDATTPFSQVNITANTGINDTLPQLDGTGFNMVFVQELTGAKNIGLYVDGTGISTITTDSVDDTMGYNNPDISADGLVVVFDKTETAGPSVNIMIYDMNISPATVVALTTDGISSMPYMSAN
jgi:Tol biopolymer transport system component